MIPPVLCPLAARVVRGQISEERVAEVCTAEAMPYWWFLWSRKASRPEDRQGIDWIVYTRDVGRILLQVKSSRAGEADFHRHSERFGRLYRIHVVVVKPDMDREVVFGRVLGTLIRAREEALAAGLTADDPRLLDCAA